MHHWITAPKTLSWSLAFAFFWLFAGSSKAMDPVVLAVLSTEVYLSGVSGIGMGGAVIPSLDPLLGLHEKRRTALAFGFFNNSGGGSDRIETARISVPVVDTRMSVCIGLLRLRPEVSSVNSLKATEAYVNVSGNWRRKIGIGIILPLSHRSSASSLEGDDEGEKVRLQRRSGIGGWMAYRATPWIVLGGSVMALREDWSTSADISNLLSNVQRSVWRIGIALTPGKRTMISVERAIVEWPNFEISKNEGVSSIARWYVGAERRILAEYDHSLQISLRAGLLDLESPTAGVILQFGSGDITPEITYAYVRNQFTRLLKNLYPGRVLSHANSHFLAVSILF